MFAIILAAGKGERIAQATNCAKQFYMYKGRPLWWHSAQAFDNVSSCQGLVLVLPKENFEEIKAELEEYRRDFSLPLFFTQGGARRQDSVLSGLQIVPKDCKNIAIHDSARPFIRTAFIAEMFEKFNESKAEALIPALEVSDTIKVVEENTVISSLKRDTLRAVQTPQIFQKDILLKAYIQAGDTDVTDDAMLLEKAGYTVHTIAGDYKNKKITQAEDLSLLQEEKQYESISSYGYDVHAYTKEEGRAFVLGTVPIPTKICIKAHSDGDVLLHALMDALLGLMGKNDIGTFFPDTDRQYENISSAILLDKVLTMLFEEEIKLKHLDITIIAQEPKIKAHVNTIRKNLSHILSLALHKVSVKATTEEGLGFTGEIKGIKAVALVSADRPV